MKLTLLSLLFVAPSVLAQPQRNHPDSLDIERSISEVQGLLINLQSSILELRRVVSRKENARTAGETLQNRAKAVFEKLRDDAKTIERTNPNDRLGTLDVAVANRIWALVSALHAQEEATTNAFLDAKCDIRTAGGQQLVKTYLEDILRVAKLWSAAFQGRMSAVSALGGQFYITDSETKMANAIKTFGSNYAC